MVVEFGAVVIMASLNGTTNGNGTHRQGVQEKTKKKIILNAFVEMCKYFQNLLPWFLGMRWKNEKEPEKARESKRKHQFLFHLPNNKSAWNNDYTFLLAKILKITSHFNNTPSHPNLTRPRQRSPISRPLATPLRRIHKLHKSLPLDLSSSTS